MSDDVYLRMVQALHERYSSLIGDAATGILRNNDRTTVDDGSVTGFDGGADELDGLVSMFEEVIGAVAVRAARKTVADVEGAGDVDLPERLQP